MTELGRLLAAIRGWSPGDLGALADVIESRQLDGTTARMMRAGVGVRPCPECSASPGRLCASHRKTNDRMIP